MPAAIEWEVTVHPIDGSEPVTRRVTGTANRFGYFGVPDAFPFDIAGEYLSTIHASFTDSDGTLWMATHAWGSGIATPDGALIAHGRRGIDAGPVEARAAWFTRSSTGLRSPGGTHISFPYHSGDSLWQTEEDSAIVGAGRLGASLALAGLGYRVAAVASSGPETATRLAGRIDGAETRPLADVPAGRPAER